MKPNLAGLVLVLAALTAAAPARPAPASLRPCASTVEPTLSVRLDLGVEAMERGAGRGRGRVRLTIEAIDEVEDLTLDLAADPALSLPDAASLPRSLGRLHRGESRTLFVTVEGPDDRDLPVRAEAIFTGEDGVPQRLGAGVTIPSSRPAPEGRLHAGALEYPAMVLPGPRP